MNKKLYFIACLLSGTCVFSQNNKDLYDAQTECQKLINNENSVFKNVCNTSSYNSVLNGTLSFNIQGEEKTIKIKSSKAELIIENEPENVYDCSYKTYSCKVNKDLLFHYKSYNLANELSLNYKGKIYNFSTIDGGTDCHIKNLDVTFKKTNKGEIMKLTFLDNIFLFGKEKNIQINKGSTLTFKTSK